uniref:Transcription factor MYB44 n=2 Tax=Cajanus cajan TaxID=3821 RepID=A0A151TYP9_CAJCA|nr:hypothetical protein KK1_004778 [Cajanus cajan]
MTNKCSRRCHHWNHAEDKMLRELVRQRGPHDWDLIAKNIEGRTGKSCRLRWFNHLDPELKKTPFSEEENERLLAAHDVYGSRWPKIAKQFPGRTDVAVKNQCNLLMAWMQRKDSKKKSFDEDSNLEEGASSSPEDELKDSGHKQVPFYDFLGVGE